MRILTLTYPLTPVAEDACGGTEQVAFQVLRGLARRPGFEIAWIGAPGSHRFWRQLGDTSSASGRLRPRNEARAPSDQRERPKQKVASHPGIAALDWDVMAERRSYAPADLLELEDRCNAAVLRYAAEHAVDLIHNQGAFFHRAAAQVHIPVLFTLHLARRLYPADLFAAPPPNLHLQCVSHSQQREYNGAAGAGVIPNGIDLERFPARRRPAGRSAPLLYLGRICPEKGPHAAIAIARQARRRLWLVGGVAPFPGHQRYFAEKIAPQLDADIRWMPPPKFAVKRALLAEAAAVVIPSRIDETSSLVAMEAAASGVPVLALRRGALPEIVADGETGWLADNDENLAQAADRLDAISPTACRARAEREFSAEAMVAGYAALYWQLGKRDSGNQ